MQPTQFGIHIKTKDFSKSLDFYLKLGFQPVFVYGPPNFLQQFTEVASAPERYRGISFNINNAILELGEDHVAIKKEVFQERIPSSKVSAMVDVASVAEVRQICEQNNFEIAKTEVDYPWGTRELVVRDPDGFILVFRQKLN